MFNAYHFCKKSIASILTPALNAIPGRIGSLGLVLVELGADLSPWLEERLLGGVTDGGREVGVADEGREAGGVVGADLLLVLK